MSQNGAIEGDGFEAIKKNTSNMVIFALPKIGIPLDHNRQMPRTTISTQKSFADRTSNFFGIKVYIRLKSAIILRNRDNNSSD